MTAAAWQHPPCLGGSYQCASKEVTMGEAGAGKEAGSQSHICKRISMKVLDMKFSGLVYVWGGLEGR